MLKEIWDVVQTVGAWPDARIAADDGGLCLSVRGVSLGHLGWSGRLDLPFNQEVGERLVAEEMAALDPDRFDAGRVVFEVQTTDDVDRAVWLLRLAYLSVGSKVDVCATPGSHPTDAHASKPLLGKRALQF